eukprot:jgi/Mesvir1/965/Mv17517-RA.1
MSPISAVGASFVNRDSREVEDYQDYADGLDEYDEPEGDAEEGEDGESAVEVMNSQNFQDFISVHPYVLVEFYAPWCGHCKALEPEFKAAAAIAAEMDPPIIFGKVDATVEEELAKEHNVEGYPTIVFFSNGKPSQYTGGRTSKDMLEWLEKKVGPAVRTLESAKDAEEVKARDDIYLVAFFKELAGAEHDEFKAFAESDEVEVPFFQTTDAAVAAVLGITGPAPAIVLRKPFDEGIHKLEGAVSAESLKSFVTAYRVPLVIPFREENAEVIFNSGIPKQVLLFGDTDALDEMAEQYKEVALAFRGKLIFVTFNYDEKETEPVLEFFGLTADSPVTVLGFQALESSAKKYKMDGAVTVANMKAFAEDLLADKLKPHLKSEPVPESNDGNVKVVVGDNFDAIVMDDTKDVLLEVYAPWCGHCKQLAPVYEKLGTRFAAVNSVVIAKMDGTKNEHPAVEIEGFPTLLLFKAGDKANPVSAESRSLKGLTKFLKKNVATPFELPKKDKAAKEDADADKGHDEL